MFFVVWGWTILLGILAGLAFGVLVGGFIGALTSEVPDAEVFDALVGAGLIFGIIFGIFGGLATGLGSGLFAAGTAALTHTRLPPVGTGAFSALVATAVTFVGLIAPTAREGVQQEAVVLLAIPLGILFVGLFLIVWLCARRSRRAARGG